LVEPSALDVEDLAADGQQRLRARIAGVEGRAAGGLALDDDQLALLGIPATAVLQLVGHAGAGEGRLAPDRIAGVLGGDACLRGGLRLLDETVGLGGSLLEPLRTS